jgi:signal transduction histidine kinase
LNISAESFGRPLYVFLAQAILGIILFFVFRHFSILYRRRFLFTWALSWLSFAIFMLSSAVLTFHTGVDPFVSVPLNVVAQLTCFLQIIMMLRGIHELVSETALNRRRFRQLLLFFLLVAIVTVVAYHEQPADTQKNLLRLGTRTFTISLGFLITGFVVWLHPRFTKGFGQRLLTVTCFIFSFYEVYYFLSVLLNTMHASFDLPDFFGVADILIISVMGMSMVMWLLEDERQKLEKAHLELDRFLYSTSHDLRAPIASIMGLTYLGKLEFQEEKAKMFMGLIEERLRKLDMVISDILSLSRTRKFELKMEPVRLKDLVEEVVADLKFSHNAAAITLDYTPDPEHVFTSDYGQMKIVMRNLVGNAVKYHNPDQPNPFIRITFRRFEEFVEIVVSDNGQGIAEEALANIFEMFYRANEKVEGTGLGLYIVKEALHRVKGTISAESTPGSGTTFTIQLEDA